MVCLLEALMKKSAFAWNRSSVSLVVNDEHIFEKKFYDSQINKDNEIYFVARCLNVTEWYCKLFRLLYPCFIRFVL